ncbi:hypothetical protein CHELA1G11_20895 [Hyphomicrobiales bacterium]|nr:hypothetical protein CHELA1G11_20895 [Hyphomicrobiales bacterium]CAH1692471.1 hypothetical protein CHELA1G2_21211 [Hyphomicrobiales bacterium]
MKRTINPCLDGHWRLCGLEVSSHIEGSPQAPGLVGQLRENAGERATPRIKVSEAPIRSDITATALNLYSLQLRTVRRLANITQKHCLDLLHSSNLSKHKNIHPLKFLIPRRKTLNLLCPSAPPHYGRLARSFSARTRCPGGIHSSKLQHRRCARV